jgi:6-methylsalicylate decarboxylase
MNGAQFVPGASSGVALPSRRELLAGLAAVGASAILPGGRLSAQAPAGNARRFDFHHHFASPRFMALISSLKESGYQTWEKNYSVAKDLEAMDRAEVATSFISLTTPGISQGNDEQTRALARDLNEFGARMASDHKGRFGLFAALPLPNIDASLREIEYAFNTLQAEGVGVITSYGNKWLGDPLFAPVLLELNRRKAILYSHPIDAPCCRDLIPGLGPTAVEYNTDTSRAIASVIVSGMADRTPDVTYIFSHAGGTMPYLVERFGIGGPDTIADILARTPEKGSKLYHLRRFYYDTAQSTNPIQMQALKAFAGASQILFGTDYPFSNIVNHVVGLKKCGFTAQELRGIDRENGLKFLPPKFNV